MGFNLYFQVTLNKNKSLDKHHSTVLSLVLSEFFSGVAIGSGWQAVVAYVNLATYYIIGLPIGCILGFKTILGVAVCWTSFSLFKLQIIHQIIVTPTHCLGYLVGDDYRSSLANNNSYHSHCQNKLEHWGNMLFQWVYQMLVALQHMITIGNAFVGWKSSWPLEEIFKWRDHGDLVAVI